MTAPTPLHTAPGRLTDPGRWRPLLDGVRGRDIRGLAALGHGLLIHERLADAYGVSFTASERATVHLRSVEHLLGAVAARDLGPLDSPRPPAARIAVNCRHFTVLAVTLLRAQGVPARARCGFGTYFGTEIADDHWVCEYWSGDRWTLLDAQLDARQLAMFPVDFDVTDVPRGRFLTAGRVWTACREGAADAAGYGLAATGESGAWWIAANLIRDAAALLGTEVLPWDTWGAMPGPDDVIDDGLAELLDRLAEATRDPDPAELRELCGKDARIGVPPDGIVHNALLGSEEHV